MRNLTVLLTILIAIGCSKTATIVLNDGTTIEGRIKRSDETNIYMLAKGSSKAEHLKAFAVPELVDKCIADRNNKCRDKCAALIHLEDYRGGMEACLKTCPNQNAARTACEADSSVTPILRSDIKDIHHPGGVRIGVSVAFTVLGAVLTATGAVVASDGGPIGAGIGAFIGIPGIVILIPSAIGIFWNYSVYSDSKSAAEPPREARISPVALTDGERTYYGLGLSWRW